MSRRLFTTAIIVSFLALCSSAFGIKIENLPRIKLPSGTKDNQVKNVKSIYVGPDGQIYVGSAQNNRVQVFSSNGQFLRSIPSTKKDNIDVAQDIDIGIDGSVYVVDRDRRELSKFDAQGMRTGTLGGKKAFKKPMSVSVSLDGKVYVADLDAKNVRIFDPSGQSLGSLQGSGFEAPVAVDVDHLGRVFVLDQKQKSVQVFDPQGGFLSDVPISYGGQEIGLPIDLCVNQNGEIFVLDGKEKIVYFISDYTSRSWCAPFGGPGVLERPIALDVVGRDNCYVLDNSNETILRFALKELPPLVKEQAIAESIMKKAIITTNIDSAMNIEVNNINAKDGQIILSVFEENRNIATGLIAENFPKVTVNGNKLGVQSAGPLASEAAIDFIFLLGTENLGEPELTEIRNKITTEFLGKLDEAKHRVAIFTFAPRLKLELPLEKSFSKQKAAFAKLNFNGEKPPVYDAIFEALKYIDTIGTKNYPIFVLVTNSAGSASRNNYETLEDYKSSHNLPQIYVLGYDSQKSPELQESLKKIADLTGGFYYGVSQQDMIYFLFRRAIALFRGQYLLKVDGMPAEGELQVSADIDLDGNLVTASSQYSGPSGEKVTIKGKSFFEKYGLLILVIILVIILIIVIIILIARARARSKAPLGEAILESKSGAPQKVYQLRKGINSIGSSKDNEIVLEIEGISRKHSAIEFSNGQYFLSDTGSTNGTFINRNRISRRVLINNDVISLGSAVEFIFKTG